MSEIKNSEFSLFKDGEIVTTIKDHVNHEVLWEEVPYAFIRLAPMNNIKTWDVKELKSLAQNGLRPFGVKEDNEFGFDIGSNIHGVVLIDSCETAYYITQLCFNGEILDLIPPCFLTDISQ